MCDKIKEIKNKTPNEILEEYNEEQFPINSQRILKNMGIKSEVIDFTPLEKRIYLNGNDHIYGLSYSDKDDLNILYSKELDEKKVNYVLAHELAHCCLHLPVSAEFHVEMKTERDLYFPNPRYRIRKRKKEREADVFAANLLIPDEKLFQIIEDTLNKHAIPTIELLSQKFNVPESTIRLKISLLNKGFRGKKYAKY